MYYQQIIVNVDLITLPIIINKTRARLYTVGYFLTKANQQCNTYAMFLPCVGKKPNADPGEPFPVPDVAGVNPVATV